MSFLLSVNSLYVLIGSVLLGALGGGLGIFAVLRKQGLLGAVLAHSAFPGIVLSFLILGEKNLFVLIIGALLSGMLSSLLITELVASTRLKTDGAMAIFLAYFFGLGILLLSYIKRIPGISQTGINDFIFGQAAGMLQLDIILIATVLVIGLSYIAFSWKRIKLLIFDGTYAEVTGVKRNLHEMFLTVLFSCGIVVSLQAVGVVLTAALFITPAVTALFLAGSLSGAMFLSVLFGMISGGVGALISINYQNVPTGATIVLVASALFTLVLLFAKNGVCHEMLEDLKHKIKVSYESFLLSFYRENEKSGEHIEVSVQSLHGGWLVKRLAFRHLLKNGLVIEEKGHFCVSEVGIIMSKNLIRKHRLWEYYLANRLNIPSDKVHFEADTMEHLLSDEMLESLEKALGYPKVDPHGKNI